VNEPVYTKEDAKNLAFSMNEAGVVTSMTPHKYPLIPKWLALCIGNMSEGDDRWVVVPQLWACLAPEEPNEREHLYLSECEACMIKLQADARHAPSVFMLHGSTHRIR
jgi:hypothetical protein